MKLGETRGTGGPKPLVGVRVLSVEQMQAMPFATQLLAHLGAEVVKVEHPQRGESGRLSRPTIPDRDSREVGATFLRNNLGKRSIGIDLKAAEGRDLFLRLAPHFDVVSENSRAGSMRALGLGYDDVAAVAPRVVYVSVSGFGNLQPSPYASWPAYAPIAEAMAGTYEPTRRAGEPPPVVVAGALGDNATALFAVIGMLAALRQREQTGHGQYVDVAMYDAMIAMMDMIPFMWSMGEPPSAATANRTGLTSAFEAKDGYFVVAIFREHQFEQLARLVGRPEWLEDARFATREGWAEQRESVVRPAIEAWARDKTKLEAARLLCERGIAAGPSNRAEDIASDPHVELRNMLIEVPRPLGGDPMLLVGNPIKLSGTPDGPIERFPSLGEHTDEVLRELLDLPEDELSGLRARGVVG